MEGLVGGDSGLWLHISFRESSTIRTVDNVGWKLTLEKVCSLVRDQVTRKVLRRIDQAGNDCPSAIGTLPEVEKCGVTACFLFDLDCTFDHGEGLVGLFFGFGAEAFDGFQGFFFAAAADEPPGGFGGEEEEDHEGSLKFIDC